MTTAKRQPYFCGPLGSWVIPTTRGKLTLISAEDVEWASQLNWACLAAGYAVASDDKSYLHRRVAERMGLFTEGCEVDHVNTDKLDNRRNNLRVGSRAQNMRNRGPNRNNVIGIKGVCWHPSAGQWIAQIMCAGVRYKQLFKLKSEAEAWVRAKREELHGDFARHG